MPTIEILPSDVERLLQRMARGAIGVGESRLERLPRVERGRRSRRPTWRASRLSVDPSLTPAEVRHAMDATARGLGTAGCDHRYGFGLVDACRAVAAVGGSCAP